MASVCEVQFIVVFEFVFAAQGLVLLIYDFKMYGTSTLHCKREAANLRPLRGVRSPTL
jgi:hypothetical protein